MLPHIARPAGQPGALPDRARRRTASSSATPSPACRRRIARFEVAEAPTARTAPTSPSRTPRATWRSPSSASSSSTPGAAAATSIEKPDRIVLDLDPGEGIAWREVVEAALHVRDELAALGLVAFAKTTGGKGVHVVVPVTPRLGWKAVHAATGDARRPRSPRPRPTPSPPPWAPANRKRPHLHRLPPQRPQRHRGRALFVAGAQQPARIRAAYLGKSRSRRRARGFELRYAPGPGRRLGRSLGGDRRGFARNLPAPRRGRVKG